MTTQRDRWHAGDMAGTAGLSDPDGASLPGPPTAAMAADAAGLSAVLRTGAATTPARGQIVFMKGDVADRRDIVNRPSAWAVVPGPSRDGKERRQSGPLSAQPLRRPAKGPAKRLGMSMQLNAGSVPSPTGSRKLVAKADGHATTGSR